MPEKTISEQVIDQFTEKALKQKILDSACLENLRKVLYSEKSKKADILEVIKEDK